VDSKLQRRPAEKQSNLDLQLQPDFQHDNSCSSPPPPSQQFGGDDYLRDLGTPQTVVKKENEVFQCKMEVDRISPESTGKNTDFPLNEDSLQNMLARNHSQDENDRRGSTSDSLVCSSSAEFVQGQEKTYLRTVRSSNCISTEGQGKPNLRTVRSSNSISTEGQGKPILRTVRSTNSMSTEGKVHELLGNPLVRSCHLPAPLLFFTVGLGRMVNYRKYSLYVLTNEKKLLLLAIFDF
jgi:hypothetical protein